VIGSYPGLIEQVKFKAPEIAVNMAKAHFSPGKKKSSKSNQEL